MSSTIPSLKYSASGSAKRTNHFWLENDDQKTINTIVPRQRGFPFSLEVKDASPINTKKNI
ncbi:hypothetical protein BpHYR1_049561 [Brachionus plicatilis]|uniref:Uncharacterized protein n=1 Tax=Brachionus plicatilis TaxID=10195 RepID=A0A3M7RJ59_BRAPC|nr:hypothetical protein BpHYR1_049561 [Brachionus plicatilis]